MRSDAGRAHAGRSEGMNRRDVEVEQSWCDDLRALNALMEADGFVPKSCTKRDRARRRKSLCRHETLSESPRERRRLEREASAELCERCAAYQIYAGARELRGVPAGMFVIGTRCAVATDVAPWRR